MRVLAIERGEYPHPFVAFLGTHCYHCAEPACVPACPVDAIVKCPEDGIVVVDSATCLGKDRCQLCLEACPYNSPQFGAEDNARMQKCNLCLERWADGKQPICVAGCPMRALDAGPLEELESRYGEIHQAAGFTYSKEVRPSVVFRPKVEVPAPSR